MDIPLRSRLETGGKDPGNIRGKRANGRGGGGTFGIMTAVCEKRIGGTGCVERGKLYLDTTRGMERGTNRRGIEGNLLHNLGCIFHADFPETIPNDVAVFVLPNLNVTAAANRVFVGEQVKVLVINFDEGSLESEVPGTGSFLAELPWT